MCCFIDSSGSMTDPMLMDLLGEVKGCMEQFTNFVLRLCFFDTETYTIHEFDPSNIDDYDMKLKAAVVLSLIVCLIDPKQKTLSQKLIVFPDGYPWGSWGDEDYCDTLFNSATVQAMVVEPSNPTV